MTYEFKYSISNSNGIFYYLFKVVENSLTQFAIYLYF